MTGENNRIEECISYDPISGVFTWLVSRGDGKTYPGARAGFVDARGYASVYFSGKNYRAHRLAWRLMTGEWPDPELYIDHIDGNPCDNRWGNLRLATNSQNQANRKNHGKYPKGVSRSGKKYKAEAKKDGKSIYLGVFETPEAAGMAYLEAAKIIHGDFARREFSITDRLHPSQKPLADEKNLATFDKRGEVLPHEQK